MRRTSRLASSSLGQQLAAPQRFLYYSTQPDPKQARLVLTAAGPDRVGVTAAITKAVVDAQGDVDSGRLTSLGGDYCIHMLVSVPETQEQAFRKEAQAAVGKFGDWDLSIRKNTPREAVSPGLRQRLVALSGEDKPGIMHAVSSFFADKGINILSMNVYNEPAPFASSRLFKLQALVQVPQGMSDDQLEEGVDTVGEKEGVDIWLESSQQPATPPAALHEAAPQANRS